MGERQTGRTSIAVDALITQSLRGTVCIKVAIGQRMSAVRRHGRADCVIAVVTPAADQPGLRWLAPFSAPSMAAWFRDRGDHGLIVCDGLTKHAATGRELALLARQPPGCEADPGDISYLHARLLERSGKLSAALGGGLITALPVAEIDAGNLLAHVPTHPTRSRLTSATLFAANQRPAVDCGCRSAGVAARRSPAR